MKVKTALKQSKASLKFLGVAIPVMLGLFAFTRIWHFLAIAGFMTLYLVVEIIIVVRIQRRARKDPAHLDEKI